jgi:hypothetical protein
MAPHPIRRHSSNIGFLATFLTNGILQIERKARAAAVKDPSGVQEADASISLPKAAVA